MYRDPHSFAPKVLWVVGFFALGTLSAIGASALFPWYLAVLIAVLVAGLASACAFQFRATGNFLYLVSMMAMTCLAAGLDGISVWEILNKRQNQEVIGSAAENETIKALLVVAQEKCDFTREEIASLRERARNMDNDGRAENDHLIPGVHARIEAKQSDLSNQLAKVDQLEGDLRSASTALGVQSAERHVLLQWAEKQENPALWLVGWAGLIFLIPEFTLALLAYSLRPDPARDATPAATTNVYVRTPNGYLVPHHSMLAADGSGLVSAAAHSAVVAMPTPLNSISQRARTVAEGRPESSSTKEPEREVEPVSLGMEMDVEEEVSLHAETIPYEEQEEGLIETRHRGEGSGKTSCLRKAKEKARQEEAGSLGSLARRSVN